MKGLIVLCFISVVNISSSDRGVLVSQRNSHLVNWGTKHRTITRKLRDPSVIKVRVNGETGLKTGSLPPTFPSSDNAIKDNSEKNETSDSAKSKKPALQNIKDPDSPYALLNEYFRDKPFVRNPLDALFPNRSELITEDEVSNNHDDYDGLDQSEIHLVDGSMIVLTGWHYNKNYTFEDPDEPIDDYEAPYRAPKLPPPGFFPDGLFPIDGPDAGFGFPFGNDIQDGPVLPIGFQIPNTGIPIGFGPPGIGLYHYYSTPFNSYSSVPFINTTASIPGISIHSQISEAAPPSNNLDELIHVPHNALVKPVINPPSLFDSELEKLIKTKVAPNVEISSPKEVNTAIVNNEKKGGAQELHHRNFNSILWNDYMPQTDRPLSGSTGKPSSHAVEWSSDGPFQRNRRPLTEKVRTHVTNYQRPIINPKVTESFRRNYDPEAPIYTFLEKPLKFHSIHSFTTSTRKPISITQPAYESYDNIGPMRKRYPQSSYIQPTAGNVNTHATGSYSNIHELKKNPRNQNPLLLGDFELSGLNTESILEELGFYDFGKKLSRVSRRQASQSSTLESVVPPIGQADDFRDHLSPLTPNSQVLSDYQLKPSTNRVIMIDSHSGIEKASVTTQLSANVNTDT